MKELSEDHFTLLSVLGLPKSALFYMQITRDQLLPRREGEHEKHIEESGSIRLL